MGFAPIGKVTLQKHVFSWRQLLEPRAQYASDSSLMTTEPDPGILVRLAHSYSPTGRKPGRSGRLVGGHVQECVTYGRGGSACSHLEPETSCADVRLRPWCLEAPSTSILYNLCLVCCTCPNFGPSLGPLQYFSRYAKQKSQYIPVGSFFFGRSYY